MFYPSLGSGIIVLILAVNGDTYQTTFTMAGRLDSCSAGTYAQCGTTTCPQPSCLAPIHRLTGVHPVLLVPNVQLLLIRPYPEQRVRRLALLAPPEVPTALLCDDVHGLSSWNICAASLELPSAVTVWGKYSTATVCTSSATCSGTCSAGSYAPAASSACTLCAIGKYCSGKWMRQLYQLCCVLVCQLHWNQHVHIVSNR